MSKAWLGKIFKSIGKVVDIYISRKVCKTSVQPVAFVRFETKEEAVKAMKSCNGMEVRGNIIHVKELEFKRGTECNILPSTILCLSHNITLRSCN